MADVLFTSDTHFGHAGIIGMCQRPFRNVRDMDEALIANWNAVVSDRDVVWHLGDFAHRGDPVRLRAIFERLKGQKFLITGNHDDAATRALPWQAPPVPMAEIVVDHVRLVLCHYAMRDWPYRHRGAISLFGHAHGRMAGTPQSVDVGVDVWGFCPIRLSQIRQRLTRQPVVDNGDLAPPQP